VVYNNFGTETELLVPIIAKGTLTASLYHEEYGTVHAYLYVEPKVMANAFVEFYHHNDPWDANPIAAEYAFIQHGEYGVVTNTYATRRKPWLLTVDVWVGKNPGDRAYYTVRLGSSVNGTVTAYSPKPTNPERLFYSEVCAFAEAKMVSPEMEALRLVGRTTVDAEAAARPAIYIDPTWEHADKFAVAFPDNLTPVSEESGGVVFADGFENGFTLLWSSTVP
jgi:hypothetical protein